ncbi:MAG: HAD family hydrolase [Pseudonocardiaceae bacterium]
MNEANANPLTEKDAATAVRARRTPIEGRTGTRERDRPIHRPPAVRYPPDILQIALERGGVAPDAAVFVGDTVWDVEACKKAGLACIALLTGGISCEELREAGAVEIYDGPAELLESLPDSLIAR